MLYSLKTDMATANTVSETQTPSAPSRTGLLVFIAPMATDQMENIFAGLTALFPADDLLIATSNDPAGTAYSNLRVVPTTASNAIWPLAATDFLNAYRIAKEHEARGVLVLGPGADSLRATALHDLANAVLESRTDVAFPYYTLPPHTGLVNSAILYPLSRSLFASRMRFPLSLDMGLSLRMAERLANAGQRFASVNQGDAILWPLSEACAAGLAVDQVDVGPRLLPQPAEPNINAVVLFDLGLGQRSATRTCSLSISRRSYKLEPSPDQMWERSLDTTDRVCGEKTFCCSERPLRQHQLLVAKH